MASKKDQAHQRHKGRFYSSKPALKGWECCAPTPRLEPPARAPAVAPLAPSPPDRRHAADPANSSLIGTRGLSRLRTAYGVRDRPQLRLRLW